jgi:hypothetical protein
MELDKIISQTGPAREKLQEIVGERAVGRFIFDRLWVIISNRYPHDESAPIKKLMDLEGIGDVRELAASLVKELESLPWTYLLSFGVPEDFGEVFAESIGKIQLDRTVWLRSRAEAEADGIVGAYVLPAVKNPMARMIDFAPQKTPNALLQIQVDGFIGILGGGDARHRALAISRSFYGLGISFGIFKFDKDLPPGAKPEKVQAFRRIDGSWVSQDTVEIEGRHVVGMASLALGMSGERAVAGGLISIANAFNLESRLLKGAEWYFENYCTDDVIMKYVHAMIALETLLGEDDEKIKDRQIIGISTLLANRCAYLLAESKTERQEILLMFKSIYDVRSRIVHAGKNRLLPGEHQNFLKLLELCRRVILKEAKMLGVDKARQNSRLANLLKAAVPDGG